MQLSDHCVWYQCLNPPLPENNKLENRLNLLWDPQKPVDFGSTVSYSCAGFSLRNDTFFEHDRDLEYFSIECRKDGYFNTPEKWPKCIKGIMIEIIIYYSVQP